MKTTIDKIEKNMKEKKGKVKMNHAIKWWRVQLMLFGVAFGNNLLATIFLEIVINGKETDQRKSQQYKGAYRKKIYVNLIIELNPKKN